MPRRPGAARALDAELKARVDRLVDRAGRPLNESEIVEAERLARVLDLRDREDRPRLRERFALLAIFVTGVLMATLRQAGADVRISVEATAGQVVVRSREPVALGIPGDSIRLNGFAVEWTPAELDSVLQPREAGEISFQAAEPGGLTLERLSLPQGSTMWILSDTRSVSFHLRCDDPCREGHLRLAARGELRSGAARASLARQSGVDFTLRAPQPSLSLTLRDSAGTILTGPMPVKSAEFRQPRFFGSGGAHTVGTVSTIHSGAVTLPEYPARSRTLARGDELHVAGSRLQLTVVERQGGRLVFMIDGKASELRLGRDDLRPSWWDWVRTLPAWPIVLGCLGGLGGLLTLLNLDRGRER
jgi:hypothetical protein